MLFKSILPIILLVYIISSCIEPTNYIIPVDFEKYEKEYIPGLTHEGSHEILTRQWKEVLEKTIGKELPDLIVMDQVNSEIRLKSLINEKTLLVLTGAHCGWGMEGLTNDLPYALNKLKEEKIEINVICLFIRTDSDDEDIKHFNTSFNELKYFYPNIYVIPEKESNRLNVFANPTRMLIDQDKSVIRIGIGVSTPEKLYEKLKNCCQQQIIAHSRISFIKKRITKFENCTNQNKYYKQTATGHICKPLAASKKPPRKMTLTKIKCPSCGELIFPRNGIIKPTSSYNDCLRRCEKCEIGFSNSKNNPTVIYNKYFENVPEFLRQDLDISLNHSINEMNRKNKKNKFGFSTSEDALTWSFFKYFVVKNKFNELLKILNINSKEATFDIYLWGTNICKFDNNSNFIDKFIAVSDSFNEVSVKRTEPDVILKLKDKLVFIEVKYLSSNELKTDKEKFKKYLVPDVIENEVIESEHYELFRNWAFASKLSNEDNFKLINLAPQKLFSDKNRNKLIKFENSLKSTKGDFTKLSWEEVLAKVNDTENELWFKEYLDEKLNASR